MLAFGMVTLFLMMLLYGLQCFVLDYFLITMFSPFCYAFVAVDGLIITYMLFSYNIDYAATRGGVQWIVYSWSFLIKLIIYYWFIFGDGKSLDYTLLGSVGVYTVMFLTPIQYCILSFRASQQLYGPASTTPITVESMLHADMVVHVMLDLLDLITAFHYADLPETVKQESAWIHTLIGVVIVVGIFLHSYSFPTTAGTTGPGKDPTQADHQGDIFLTRKLAALVAMFSIDIPMIVIRTYLWVVYPKSPGFSPFLVKNIVFLPVQAFRLNQCRLAERERARSSQRKSYYISEAVKEGEDVTAGVAMPGAPSPQQPQPSTPTLAAKVSGPVTYDMAAGEGGQHYDTSSPVPGTLLQSSQTPTTRKTPASMPMRRRKRTAVIPQSQPGAGSQVPSSPTRAGIARISSLQAGKFPDDSCASDQRGSRTAYYGDSQHPSQTYPGFETTKDVRFQSNEPTSTGLDEASSELSPRGRPRAASVSRFKYDRDKEPIPPGPAGLRPPEVDSSAGFTPVILPDLPRKKVEQIIQDLKSVREVPVKSFGIWKLTVKIFHCLRLAGRHGLPGILDDSFVLGYWKQIRIAIPLLVAWASQIAIVALTRDSINESGPSEISSWRGWSDVPPDYQIFVFFGSANLILMFLLWLGTAPLLDVIYVSVMWACRFTSFFLVFATFRDTGVLELQTKWKLPNPTQPILIWIFILLPCLRILDALWPIQSAFLGRKCMYFVVPATNKKIQSAILTTATTLKENQLDEQKRPLSDEFSWVTTSSALIFLNCRNSFAPISYGELLIGPDLIKNVRLIDMLVLRSWLELGYVLILELIALFLFFSFVNMGIFAGVIVMQFIYNIFIQAIRLLALRRYEVKVLFEQIVTAWSAESLKGSESELTGTLAGGGLEMPEEVLGGDTQFQSSSQKLIEMRKRRFISLLDIMEKYQRHGFFTSPGDLLPSFF